MKTNRSAFRGPVVAAAMLAAATGLCLGADLQLIHSDGTVHRIGVSPWTSPGGSTGTFVRHQIQSPSGSKQSVAVPGTEDGAYERSPVIGIDAADGSLFAAWVREDAGVAVLRIARWSAGAWGQPIALDGPGKGVGSPRLVVGANWLHVAWTESANNNDVTAWRGVYRKDDFGRTFGPELLPTAGGDGPADGLGDPPTSEGIRAYFAFVLPGSNPNDPGSFHLWGIRDEPVPIGYHEGMPLPVDSSDVRDLGAKNVGCTPMLWLQTSDRLIYRTYGGTAWSDYRVVNLDFLTPPEAARRQVEEMLRRR